jgi:hypothetical protein
LIQFVLDYSYEQFHIFDLAEGYTAFKWTEGHLAQGFARDASCIGVTTLTNDGLATVSVQILGCDQSLERFTRVIAVPFYVTSGQVCIQGPEEAPSARVLELTPGVYWLKIAQLLVSEDSEEIYLCFLRPALLPTTSEIIVKDSGLHPPTPLLEYCAS